MFSRFNITTILSDTTISILLILAHTYSGGLLFILKCETLDVIISMLRWMLPSKVWYIYIYPIYIYTYIQCACASTCIIDPKLTSFKQIVWQLVECICFSAAVPEHVFHRKCIIIDKYTLIHAFPVPCKSMSAIENARLFLNTHWL